MALGEFFKPFQEDISKDAEAKKTESAGFFREAADLAERGGDIQALNESIEQGRARIAGSQADFFRGAAPEEPTPGVRDLTDVQDRAARTLLMIDRGETSEEDRFTYPTLKDAMMYLRPFEPDELASEEAKRNAEKRRYASIRTARIATLEMIGPALDDPQAAPPKISELLSWARGHHPVYERAMITDFDEAMRRVVSVQDLRRRFTNSS